MKTLLVVVFLILTATLSHAQSTPKWVRTNHHDLTSSLSFSSDGKYLASASYGYNEIILWDGLAGTFIKREFVRELKQINCAVFLPGTHTLVLAGDSTIYSYDVLTQKVMTIIAGDMTLNVDQLKVSQTGDTLAWLRASNPYDPAGSFYFYDRTRAMIFDSVSVYGEWSRWRMPGANSILISDDLQTYVYHRTNDSVVIHTPDRDTFWVNDVMNRYDRPQYLSPDGRYLLIQNLKTDKIDSLTLGTMERTAGVDDLPEYREEGPQIEVHSSIAGIGAFTDNRNSITPEYGVFDGYIMFVKSGDTTNITGLIGEIALSPVEPIIAAGGMNGEARYDYDGNMQLGKKGMQGNGVIGLSYSYAGELSLISLGDISNDFTHQIIVGGRSYTHYMAGMFFSCFNSPKIDPAANQFAMGLEMISRDTTWFAMKCPVVTAEWTPSGSHYIWSAFDESFYIQDRAGARLPVGTDQGKVTSLAVSWQGDLIATAGTDGSVKLWSIDGQLVRTFTGHTGVVNDVNFAPNGRQLVSASADSTIRVWDIDKGEIYKYSSFKEPFLQAAVSNDGLTVIAASDRSIVGFNASDWASVKPADRISDHEVLKVSRKGSLVTVRHGFDPERPAQLEVYDLLGRMLYHTEFASESYAFDASAYGTSPLLLAVTQAGKTASVVVAGQ